MAGFIRDATTRLHNDQYSMNTLSSRFLRTALLVLCLAAGWTAPRAQAWNATGHMTIASMTYDQLSPAARAHWTELLQQHPDFAKWEAAEPKDQPDFELGRYLFMKASTWPDDIRKSGSAFDHPVWHYIDYPLVEPDFPLEPAPDGHRGYSVRHRAVRKRVAPTKKPLRAIRRRT